MAGKIYITRNGYDPQKGGYIKDPYLEGQPTMGACRPDVRRSLGIGDTIFVVSGGVEEYKQFIIGCFDIQEKITMQEAYKLFPEQRLHRRDDGQLAGNIIIDGEGQQHKLDNHDNFSNRMSDYIIGTNEIILRSDSEIKAGREQTMDMLRGVLNKSGSKPFDILGRAAPRLSDKQVEDFKAWLQEIKNSGGTHG